ncbi:PilZ domain-containing protein [Desulfobulbus sp.]|uniref:PilZ domain-containing protein n=1 Tax=Desulfobulbus sp. TaxID=895 RepID=UPI00286F3B27|nr:PilZ domain-containing protein [Desulfobulbus sp.]
MKPLTVYVRADNTATLTCPACGTVKHFSASAYRSTPHLMTVRCGCSASFPVLLNFRCNFRKQTNLPGTYQIIGPKNSGGGMIQVTNLSRGGAEFTVSGMHNLAMDQEIQIEIQLNDKKQTVLKKQAVIKSVRKNVVGCEFKNHADLDKALGFFLQS